MSPEASGEWEMEGKGHEHVCYPGGVSVDSEERLSIRISLCLPHHSLAPIFLLRVSPKAHHFLPQGSLPFGHSFIPSANTHLNRGSSLCSPARPELVSLEPVCGVYALGHRALCHIALGSQLAGAWTRGHSPASLLPGEGLLTSVCSRVERTHLYLR